MPEYIVVVRYGKVFINNHSRRRDPTTESTLKLLNCNNNIIIYEVYRRIQSPEFTCFYIIIRCLSTSSS